MATNPTRLAIYNKLAATGAVTDLVSTRVYFQFAPQGSTYPLITFNRQSGRPDWTSQGDPVENELWQVKGIATGSSSATAAENIADAIDAALQDAIMTVTGRDVLLKPLRESDVDYAEITDGVLYRHAGALYRLMTE